VVAVGELADHQSPARPQHPAQLVQRGQPPRDLAEHGDQVGGVEGRVGERQRGCVSLARLDVADRALSGPGHHVAEHLLLDVHDHKLPVRAKLRRHVQRLQPGPRADLEHPLARPRLQQRVQPARGEQRQRDIKQPVLRVWVRGPVAEDDAGGDRSRAECARAEQHPLHAVPLTPRAIRAASQNAAPASGSSTKIASATARP
jgi:hypothetical protein